MRFTNSNPLEITDIKLNNALQLFPKSELGHCAVGGG